MGSEAGAATVKSIDLPGDLLQRAEAASAGLTLLPLRVEDGRAVYPEHSMMLVKQLKALGADVEFADAADERAFEVRKSALATVVATLVLGIASNASWDIMKAYIRRFRDKPERLSVTYVGTREDGGSIEMAWSIEGSVESVIE